MYMSSVPDFLNIQLAHLEPGNGDALGASVILTKNLFNMFYFPC